MSARNARGLMLILAVGFVSGCAASIAQLKESHDVDALLNVCVYDERHSECPMAMSALEKMGKPAVLRLARLVEDDLPTGKKASYAALVLGRVGAEAWNTVPTLVPTLVRVFPTLSLSAYDGRSSDFQSVDPLLREFRDVETTVDSSYAISLAGTPMAPQHHVSTRIRHETTTYFVGASALQAITGRDFGKNRGAWEEWWKAEGTSLLTEGTSLLVETTSLGVVRIRVLWEKMPRGTERNGDSVDRARVLRPIESVEGKIGRVALTRAVYATNEIPSDRWKLILQKQKEISEQVTAFNDIRRELQSSSGITDATRQKLAELNKRLPKLPQTARDLRELASKEAEMTAPIIARLKRIVARIGVAEDFTMIVDMDQARPDTKPQLLDLTDEVVRRYRADEDGSGDAS